MTLPAKDSFSTYGGVKEDFIDVVDPTTDRSAVEVNTAFASLSMLTRTTVKAAVQFDGYAGVPTVAWHEALWGNTSALKPTVTRNSAGNYTITWAATITDPLDDTQSVVLKSGWANVEAGAGAFFTGVTIVGNNAATLITRNSAGTAADIGTAYKVTVFVI